MSEITSGARLVGEPETSARYAAPAPDVGTGMFARLLVLFFPAYVLVHYAILAGQRAYGPSLLDEAAFVILLPLALAQVVRDRWSRLIAVAFAGYGFFLVLGALVSGIGGIPQPRAALVSVVLDSKPLVMAFAFAWMFGRDTVASRSFRLLCVVFIGLCLLDAPFVLRDLFSDVSIHGEILTRKGAFTQPHGLFGHHTETAWLYVFGAFAAAARHRISGRRAHLVLAAGFFGAVVVILSIKEVVACTIGLPLVLHGHQIRSRRVVVRTAVVALLCLGVLASTNFGTAMLEHLGMFVGAESLDTVRREMTVASVQIAHDYFPFGTGGGTFGSPASIQNGYSDAYSKYYIDTLYGGSREMPDFLQDGTWPKILGESGAFGTAFFVTTLVLCWLPLIRMPVRERDDCVLRLFAMATVVLTLLVSIASAPFTNELLEFMCAYAFGLGLGLARRTADRAERAAGPDDAVLFGEHAGGDRIG